jgi:DNA-binding transcriptional MerR regulator
MARKATKGKSSLVKISELARMAGVSTPTIKHYMAEGLLPEPALRTSRNMAYYEPVLAERIKAIKTLQKSHFFPLRVIGELLEPAPSARLRADIDQETRNRLGLMVPPVEAEVLRVEARSMSREEVLEALEMGEDDLELLASMGLATPHTDRGQQLYSGADLDLLEVIDETRRKGLGDVFPMEILPDYTEFLRKLVQQELDLFRKRVLDGKVPEGMPLDFITREAAKLGERLVVAMRSKLLLSELRSLVTSGNME